MGSMNIIIEGLFGSHLYGLNTTASDKDYKGIYLPTKREILLGTAPKTIDLSTNKSNVKNTSEDTDREFYSLQYFVQNALKGETFAIDMLHMKEAGESFNGIIWSQLRHNRTKFYSKNMKSFIGYARRQAAKYSIKGSRLAFLEEMVSKLKGFPQEDKLGLHSGVLVEGEFSKFKTNTEGEYWEAVSKIFFFSTPIYHVVDSLEKIAKGYGNRAKLARDNLGVDWKAVSHAFRAAYQQRAIFEDGDFEYPLRETPFLKLVKAGSLDFITEVQGELEKVVDEVSTLAESSSLPDLPDHKLWDNFIEECHTGVVRGSL
jgi:hypothetical protein